MEDIKALMNCLMHGCGNISKCFFCGFNRREAQRRKHIPLTPNEAGLLHKNVAFPQQKESVETE